MNIEGNLERLYMRVFFESTAIIYFSFVFTFSHMPFKPPANIHDGKRVNDLNVTALMTRHDRGRSPGGCMIHDILEDEVYG